MENEVKEDKVLKKANQAIMGKAAPGKNLTLLTRKLMNALAYFAQSAGQLGMGPPAAIRDAVAKQLEQEREVPESFWWVPLSEVVSCTAFDSNDIKLLKKKCIELQSMQLITDSDIFGSRSLFTAIYILNSNGSVDKKGGQLWICWKYAPVAADAILNPPVGFTKLNLFYQAKLTSTASLALYEIGRSYVYPSNPSPRTKAEHWHYWFRLLSGVADDVTPPEFKYANRDVFLHAVNQVSNETDIDVEMVVDRKVGKAVADIHFRFKAKTREVQRVVDGPLGPCQAPLGHLRSNPGGLLGQFNGRATRRGQVVPDFAATRTGKQEQPAPDHRIVSLAAEVRVVNQCEQWTRVLVCQPGVFSHRNAPWVE